MPISRYENVHANGRARQHNGNVYNGADDSELDARYVKVTADGAARQHNGHIHNHVATGPQALPSEYSQDDDTFELIKIGARETIPVTREQALSALVGALESTRRLQEVTDRIRNVQSLPEKFRAVIERLPLISDILAQCETELRTCHECDFAEVQDLAVGIVHETDKLRRVTYEMMGAEQRSRTSRYFLMIKLDSRRSVWLNDAEKIMKMLELLVLLTHRSDSSESRPQVQTGKASAPQARPLSAVQPTDVREAGSSQLDIILKEILELKRSFAEIQLGQPLAPRTHSPSETDGALCLYDDGELATIDAREIDRAKQWMSNLHKSTESLWSQLAPQHDPLVTFGRPVKVAVIDTGAAIEESDLGCYDDRLVEVRSWTDGRPATKVDMADLVGHGTHSTSLVLSVTENTDCEVYAAQAFRDDPQKKGDVPTSTRRIEHGIRDAIRYAVTEWEVDIISLSFGRDQAISIVEEIIDDYAHRVLFFAAASNCGGNKPKVSWPARHGNVICIHATDGDGNSYKRNPNPTRDRLNLAVLGVAVRGLWPRDLKPDRYQYKSGTSCATPIAAGIAACILTLMRRQAMVELAKISDSMRSEATEEAERLMKKLRKPYVMREVLSQIGAHGKKRQGYDYVTPWHIFEGPAEAAYKRIKDLVDSL